VVQVEDMSIAVVSAADHPAEWEATADRPGLFRVVVTSTAEEALEPVERAIAEARRLARFVIFSIHWGPNMREHPTREFRAFARRVLDAGADVFWGHSAHVVQGIEVVGERPILYDTGDFLDDYAVDPNLRNDLSALFLLRLEDGRVASVDLVPVRIAGEHVNRAVGQDLERFRDAMAARCSELGTSVIVQEGRSPLTVPVARRVKVDAR
jgi:poly-gamma-glutamate synthesis protein (capsule biosynthesis protein)